MGLLKEAEGLGTQLQQVINTKPEDTQKAMDAAAQVLSSIADRCAPDSDLRKILLNARNAALTHRTVVADSQLGPRVNRCATEAAQAVRNFLASIALASRLAAVPHA